MAEKLHKRDDEVPFTTTTEGAALGTIPVTTIMLDRESTVELINAAASGGWKAGGSLDAADILSTLLVVGNEGKVYNVNEAFTTTSDFVEGEGKWYAAGTNIAVINAGTVSAPVYKFDVLGGTDQSVVRQINVGEASLSVLPTNGTVTIPVALSAAYGVVKLDDSIDSDNGLTAGYAATPSAVKAALLSAKNYTDALSTAIDGKLSALDYEATGMGAGKTISTLTETDGKISATFQDIAITHGQVTDWAAAVKATANALLSSNVAGAARPTTLNGTIDLLMAIVNNITALSVTA